MGELFEITYERFLDEVSRSKLSPDGNNKIEMEDLDTMFAFYLTPIGLNKTYVTVVEKTQITDVQKMNLLPFAKPARRINEVADLKNISEALKNLAEFISKQVQ